MQKFSKHILNEKARNLKEEIEDAISIDLDNLNIDAYINNWTSFTGKIEQNIQLEIAIDTDMSTEINKTLQDIVDVTKYVEEKFKVVKSSISAGINRIFLLYDLDRTEFENSNMYKSCEAIQKFDL